MGISIGIYVGPFYTVSEFSCLHDQLQLAAVIWTSVFELV